MYNCDVANSEGHINRYLLGNGKSNDGVPLQDFPRHHGGVDLDLSDGHIERS